MKKERLSGQDAAFLAFEAPGRPMHVGALALLENPAGTRPDDFAHTLREELGRGLGEVPRFRSRLERGWLGPRWSHRAGFDPCSAIRIDGDLAGRSGDALRDGLGERFARPLDRTQPLWEAWIVPAVDGGRHTALLFKAHHAMLDGSAGLAVLAGLVEADSARTPRAQPQRGPRALHRPDVAARAGRGLLGLVRRLLTPTAATSLNGPMAPAREIATLTLDEADLAMAARRAGGSRNDALLALVAEGVRRWLDDRGERTGSRTLRAFCPVDLRSERDAGALGNRLGAWLVDLPLAAAGDPDAFHARVQAAARETARTRRGGHAGGVRLLGRVARFLPALFPRLGMAIAGRLRAFNLVVTHVRGPQQPLRFAGARLESLTVLAPVFPNQRCSIAAFRLDGRIHLGLTGAWPRPGETRALAAAIGEAAVALRARECASETSPPPRQAAAG